VLSIPYTNGVGGTLRLQLDPLAHYGGDIFHLVAASAPLTGTLLTLEAACYCRGTLILTDRGDRPIEALRIGDHVVTQSGIARPIRWIGRRSHAAAAGQRDLLPVRIARGALADAMPVRDLLVSPQHAMFIDGMLIPAAALINGCSIVQPEAAGPVDYFHLELDSHDVILAEGAASESFVDNDSRAMFDNAGEYHALYPDAAPQPARHCAPRVEDGEAVETVRRRLAERADPAAAVLAALAIPAGTGRDLRGFLDHASRARVGGSRAAGPGTRSGRTRRWRWRCSTTARSSRACWPTATAPTWRRRGSAADGTASIWPSRAACRR
jgi:hypothetical protein